MNENAFERVLVSFSSTDKIIHTLQPRGLKDGERERKTETDRQTERQRERQIKKESEGIERKIEERENGKRNYFITNMIE